MENENSMDEFIDVSYLIKVRTAIRLQEIQEILNEDDQGLFDILLSLVQSEVNKKPRHISKTERNEFSSLGLTETIPSAKSDDEILESFYQEDLKSRKM